jgi:rare lipoprotein A
MVRARDPRSSAGDGQICSMIGPHVIGCPENRFLFLPYAPGSRKNGWMRARGAAVLMALGPAAFAGGCATSETPVQSAPRASHTKRAEAVPAAPAMKDAPGSPSATETSEPSGSTGHDEQSLVARYEGRRALSVQHGQATYYGNSLAGHKTASGERYNPRAFTAAHRTLPLGTVGRVRRNDNGAVVYVRITDRGPYASPRRIIDLSRAAAERLGMIRIGVAEVRLEVVEYGVKKKAGHKR